MLARIEPEIATRYPSLSDARKRELLASYFHERIDAENKQLATKMESMHTSEAIRVQAVLEKFGVGEEPPARPGEREREFLHALVDVMMDSDLTDPIILPAPAHDRAAGDRGRDDRSRPHEPADPAAHRRSRPRQPPRDAGPAAPHTVTPNAKSLRREDRHDDGQHAFPGAGDVARRLDALDETLDRAVRAARRRNLITLVLAIISLCLIAYYLRYAHREFAGWDAEQVAQIRPGRSSSADAGGSRRS